MTLAGLQAPCYQVAQQPQPSNIAMIREVSPSQYPYSTSVFIRATFANGQVYTASGAVVGRNDILTATHVVFDPDLGGYATKLEFYIGADYNFQTHRFDSAPLISLTNAQWQVLAYPAQAFQDSDNSTMTLPESQYDVALIGLNVPVGDTVGYLSLASGYNQSQWATTLGYPGGATGLLQGSAYVSHDARYSTYSAFSRDGSDILGPGSSGGPLYVTDSTGVHVIGVKSSGSSTTDNWADIGLTYNELVKYMADNDSLLGSTTSRQDGTAGNNQFFASATAEQFFGLGGVDTVTYSGVRSVYDVSRSGSVAIVANRNNATDRDTLTDIERVKFQDGTLALDTAAGQTAGSVYRLYQAALDRAPDATGLKFWISAADAGQSLSSVAGQFITSNEFRTLYGSAQTQNELLNAFYRNVLDRAPDTQGFNFWVNALNNGLSSNDLLVSFSESNENVANLSSVVNQGIWMG